MIYAKILMGIFVVVASYIFRHVGVVLCCYIEHYPNVAKNASANKFPVKIRAVSQKSFRADFLFSPVSFFIKTPKSLVNKLLRMFMQTWCKNIQSRNLK